MADLSTGGQTKRTTIMEHLNDLIKRVFLLMAVIMPALLMTTATASPVALESWNDVIATVDELNSVGSGTVRLASRSVVYVDRPLPIIIGDIVIEGNGAKLVSEPNYHGALIQIDSAGSLELKDLQIAGFDRDISQAPETFPALIDNHGELKLKRVTISENPSCQICSETLPILDNRGEASLNNVTLFDNHTRAPERNYPPNSNLRNCGYMSILNSTFAKNIASFGRGMTGVQVLAPAAISALIEDSCGPGFFEIGNTLLDNKGGNCGDMGGLSDLGGNFDSDDSCGFDPASNVINQPFVLARFGMHGGLVPTVGLEPGSPAIDTGVNEICSAMDARTANRPVRGTLGGEVRCDIGAFEYGGGFGNADLSVNGMNGLWFNLGSDGHYVHIMRVSPDRVYVNWTAFDESAQQMWIYAVADTAGSASFSAAAHFNISGQLVPGGAPEGHEVEEWGQIEIELDDCTVGVFRYHANNPAIGSGEFRLDRLAFYEGGGCSHN